VPGDKRSQGGVKVPTGGDGGVVFHHDRTSAASACAPRCAGSADPV